jgi:hypothetical protein
MKKSGLDKRERRKRASSPENCFLNYNLLNYAISEKYLNSKLHGSVSLTF